MQVSSHVDPASNNGSTPHQGPPTATTSAATGTLDINRDDRRYHARWASAGSVEHLRVNVRVEAGSNGSGKSHVETLDLYSPRSRKVFAVRVAQFLGATIDAIDQDLSEILIAVDQAQREGLASAATTQLNTKAPTPMSESERNAALALLRDPNLMDRIAADMEALGYVGESSNKKLGYLIAISRKLPEPLSAIIVSQSGAGKSGLASMLERLVPIEEMVFWSKLTPQALYYVKKDSVKHKLVVIEEREGSEAADYSIRTLQSKHKLVQAVPVKDPATNTIETVTREVEGPAAFLETTTRMHINPENASRSFELYLDETPAQTMRVQELQRTAKTPAGLELRARLLHIERDHQNAQRLLEPIPVAIPYAQLLTFPASWIRTRRDNVRLLNLIEATAFLHQKQRAKKRLTSGVEYIEATVEDYAIAYELAGDVLGFGLDELKKPVRDLLALIEAKVHELAEAQGVVAHAVSWARRDVRQWSGLPNHQVKLSMQELEELEYIEVERAPRGSRYVYRIVVDHEHNQPLVGLLTPVELYNRINEQADQAKVEQSGKLPVSTQKQRQSRGSSRT